MAKKSIGSEAWLSDYQGALVQAAGIAYILGFSDHAKTLHELSCQAIGIDTEANRRQKNIDTAQEMRYHKENQAECTPRKQEGKTMKNAKNYFEKNGFIFGDSTKFEFGKWSHKIVKFTDFSEAEKWLNTEEYDFRERELISKTKAKKYGYTE